MCVDDVTLTKEAVAALEQQRLIEAIKLTRAATGMGLKESKETVERYLMNHPELKDKIDATRVSIGLTREQIILWVVAVTMLAVYLLLVR